MSDAFSPLVDAALRGMLIALLLLVAARLLRDARRSLLGRVGAVFAFGLVVQVVGSTPSFEAYVPLHWQAPLVGVSVGNAVLFWIVVKALFDDDFTLRPWHAAVWFLVAGVGAANCWRGWDRSSTVGRLGIELQHAAPLLFAVLAAIAIGSTWQSDLVDRRRRLRLFIAVGGVAYTVAMVAARISSANGRLSEWGAVFDTAALLAMMAVVAFGSLRVVDDAWWASTTQTADDATPPTAADASPSSADDDPEDARLAEILQRTMRENRFHRVEGLTVLGLAQRLSIPEYRLRRMVNRRLGFRNFNAFVNSYRLDEARQALADPARDGLPVLTIALEAGFQSIGPFNRAFKAATGTTPTEYRQRHRADS